MKSSGDLKRKQSADAELSHSAQRSSWYLALTDSGTRPHLVSAQEQAHHQLLAELAEGRRWFENQGVALVDSIDEAQGLALAIANAAPATLLRAHGHLQADLVQRLLTD